MKGLSFESSSEEEEEVAQQQQQQQQGTSSRLTTTFKPKVLKRKHKPNQNVNDDLDLKPTTTTPKLTEKKQFKPRNDIDKFIPSGVFAMGPASKVKSASASTSSSNLPIGGAPIGHKLDKDTKEKLDLEKVSKKNLNALRDYNTINLEENQDLDSFDPFIRFEELLKESKASHSDDEEDEFKMDKMDIDVKESTWDPIILTKFVDEPKIKAGLADSEDSGVMNKALDQQDNQLLFFQFPAIFPKISKPHHDEKKKYSKLNLENFEDMDIDQKKPSIEVGRFSKKQQIQPPISKKKSKVAEKAELKKKNDQEELEKSKIGKLDTDLDGIIGKLVIYKSGAVKIKIGDLLYDVNPTPKPKFVSTIAVIDMKPPSSSEVAGEVCNAVNPILENLVRDFPDQKRCYMLGDIKNHYIVTPDLFD